jgi:hypothetical protein
VHKGTSLIFSIFTYILYKKIVADVSVERSFYYVLLRLYISLKLGPNIFEKTIILADLFIERSYLFLIHNKNNARRTHLPQFFLNNIKDTTTVLFSFLQIC